MDIYSGKVSDSVGLRARRASPTLEWKSELLGLSDGWMDGRTDVRNGLYLTGENLDVICERPTVSGKYPDVICERPTVTDEYPDVICERPTVIGKYPDVICERPTITVEYLDVICERPTVTGDYSDVICERPTVTGEPWRNLWTSHNKRERLGRTDVRNGLYLYGLFIFIFIRVQQVEPATLGWVPVEFECEMELDFEFEMLFQLEFKNVDLSWDE